ncbi:hypothetical protein NPIL_598081 [Nephila pilipes]|uniref:Uncharacterized protein n=1 Tax=Nephila pilipes TaxID=299642 RepID=A0A8X6PEF4_NEPPI|nr:hypothetical protein NPIL_598081 [Nephila pilipes]
MSLLTQLVNKVIRAGKLNTDSIQLSLTLHPFVVDHPYHLLKTLARVVHQELSKDFHQNTYLRNPNPKDLLSRGLEEKPQLSKLCGKDQIFPG